jgi:hypothetical protein
MVAESMAKTVETCCRCGSPLEHDPVLILVQSGPLHSAHPVINLCPSCADSMTRWFARGQRSRPADRASKPTGRSDGPSHHRRHRRRSRRKRRALARGALAVTIVVIVFSIVGIIIYEFYAVAARLLAF